MVKAVFLDFYGTVVHEDGEIIAAVCREIRQTGTAGDAAEAAAFWWGEFQALCLAAHGDAFQTQRALERESQRRTLRRVGSAADAGALSETLFAYWERPEIFADAPALFAACPVPVYLVSNIDTGDIQHAIKHHGLAPAGVFTSEMARSYKPRGELFRLALRETGLRPEEAVHAGDSLRGDVLGARAAGIPAVWVNRRGKPPPPEADTAVATLPELLETPYFRG